MELSINYFNSNNLIGAYSVDYIIVDQQKKFFPLLITNQFIIESPDLLKINWNEYEIIILGFLKQNSLKDLVNLPLYSEKMSYQAACRTFNILLSEGRNIALLIV